MFHPRPQTHQIPRHYTSQHASTATSRKNTNKENAYALPSKTPSRVEGGAGAKAMLLAGTGPAPMTGKRLGLGGENKTVGRDRNVLAAQVDKGKGKGKEVDDIAPKRLFASTSKTLPPSKSFSALPFIRQGPAAQPTKTPGKALRTPAPAHRLPPAEPEPTPLPSAARPRRRSRQSLTLTPAAGAGVGADLRTPARQGWEEGASLESITEGLEGVDVGHGLDDLIEDAAEVDDEVEYMPPKVVPLPWEPIVALPDIEPVMRTLAAMPLMWGTLDEWPESPLLEEPVPDVSSFQVLDDNELEEPIFRKATFIPTPASSHTTTERSSVPQAAVRTKATAQPNSSLKTGRTRPGIRFAQPPPGHKSYRTTSTSTIPSSAPPVRAGQVRPTGVSARDAIQKAGPPKPLPRSSVVPMRNATTPGASATRTLPVARPPGLGSRTAKQAPTETQSAPRNIELIALLQELDYNNLGGDADFGFDEGLLGDKDLLEA